MCRTTKRVGTYLMCRFFVHFVAIFAATFADIFAATFYFNQIQIHSFLFRLDSYNHSR